MVVTQGMKITYRESQERKESKQVQVNINRSPLQMELATGATVSVISEYDWKRLFNDDMVLLELYTGPLLHCIDATGK